MLPELNESIMNKISERLNTMHTAMPGTVVSYDPASGLATVLPIAEQKNGHGNLDYPQISGVPVVLIQGNSQKATVAYPVKPGDDCLLIIAEQPLDRWLSNKRTPTDLKYSLTNAIAIPGLFRKANALIAEANQKNAVIAKVDGTILEVAPEGVTITGDVTVKGNIKQKGNLDIEGSIRMKGGIKAWQGLSIPEDYEYDKHPDPSPYPWW